MQSPADVVRGNPNCNYFISASAGTGKTYTLTNYYLGILESHEPAEDPGIVDAILAVTFTNKAANEMKDRIMNEIRRKLHSLQNSNEPSQAKVRRYWSQVYSNMSRAVISTIDSFCRRILVEQNVVAGIDPGFKIISELRKLKVIDEVSRLAIEIAFKIYDGENIDFHPFIPSERRKVLDRLVEELKLNREGIMHLFEAVGDVETVRNFVSDIVKSWRLELSRSRISDKLMRTLARAGGALKALRTVGLIACHLFEVETLDNFEYDFKGVLERTFLVLQDPNVRRFYQERFKYIIVDEFQDTNDLQKSIFDLLHTERNYVFYVGDRKQSIYRFRGADVSVFVRTLAEFEERRKRHPERYKVLALRTNHRSHVRLVEFFNSISRDAIFNNKVYEDLTSGENRRGKRGTSASDAEVYRYEVFRLRFPELYEKLWFTPDDESLAINIVGGEEVLPRVSLGVGGPYVVPERVNYLNITQLADDRVESEAKLVAWMVMELVGQEMTFYEKTDLGPQPVKRRVEFRDIAVLSYRLSPIESTFREVFAKFGVPLYVVKGRGFYRRPEVRAVVSALKVIQNPNGNYNFTEFFFTPFVESPEGGEGFEKFKVFHRIVSRAREIKERDGTYSLFQAAKELMELGELPAYVTEALRIVQKYDELKYFLRPAKVLRNFIKESCYLEKLAKLEGAEQRIKNVKKLLDQASELDQQASTFLELTRLLERLDELQETEASEVSEDANVVRLMTVHASKGLEFNIVFLVGNDFSERDEEKVIFPYADESGGKYLYVRDFLERFKTEIDRTSDEYKELMKELEAEVVYDETELLRKIYVAITRAREMLFIVTSPDSKSSRGGTAKKFLNPSNLRERLNASETRLFAQFDVGTEFFDSLNSVFPSDNEVVEVGPEPDLSRQERTLSDLRGLAFRRYLSPTILCGFADEKSSIEANDEETLAELGASAMTLQPPSPPSGFLDVADRVLRRFIDAAPEVLEGKEIHRRLMSVSRYSELEHLAEMGKVPRALLRLPFLKELFDHSDRILSEWRLARHFELDGRRYVLFGAPDKVFFTRDGLYVVDFKSALRNVETPELDRYVFQLRFYMWLLENFGRVSGGYLVSTTTGRFVKVGPPGADFLSDLIERIRRFESANT